MQINSQFLIKASFKSLNWRLLQKQGERDICFEYLFLKKYPLIYGTPQGQETDWFSSY